MTTSGVGGVLVQHPLLHHHREVEEHRDDQERGGHREGQLQRHVVAELTRQFRVALLLAVKHHRPEEQDVDDRADDERGDQRADPQFPVEVRLGGGDAVGPAEAEYLGPAAPAEQDRRPAQEHGQCHQLQAASGHVGASLKCHRTVDGPPAVRRLHWLLRSVDHTGGQERSDRGGMCSAGRSEATGGMCFVPVSGSVSRRLGD